MMLRDPHLLWSRSRTAAASKADGDADCGVLLPHAARWISSSAAVFAVCATLISVCIRVARTDTGPLQYRTSQS